MRRVVGRSPASQMNLWHQMIGLVGYLAILTVPGPAPPHGAPLGGAAVLQGSSRTLRA